MKTTSNIDVAQTYILDGVRCNYVGKHKRAWLKWLKEIDPEPVLRDQWEKRQTFLKVCREIGLGHRKH